MPLRQTPLGQVKAFYFSVAGVVLTALFLGVLIKANYSLYVRNGIARENRDTLERELHELHERKAALTATLATIGTKKGQEIAVRKQFDIGKPGEHLLVVVDDSPEEATKPLEEGWWSTLRHYVPFFH